MGARKDGPNPVYPSTSLTLRLRSPFVFAQGEDGGGLHAERRRGIGFSA